MSDSELRLKEAREAAGWRSARAAAENFGWNATTYQHHENGTRGFKASTARTYAQKFKVSVEWLLYGKSQPVSVPTRTISLPVMLPSEQALTGMFEGLFEALDFPQLAAELSPRLAVLLPDALARALDERSDYDLGHKKLPQQGRLPPPGDRPERR